MNRPELSTIDTQLVSLRQQGLKSTLDLDPSFPAENVIKVQSLFVHSELPAQTTAAIHGTSFEILKEVLRSGVLPGEIIKGDYVKGFLAIEPVNAVIEQDPNATKALRIGYANFMEAVNEYEGFAKTIAPLTAQIHALQDIFGLKRNSEEDYQLVLKLVDPTTKPTELESAFDALQQRGFSDAQITTATNYSLHLSGFCIGLDSRVFTDYKYSEVASEGRAPQLKAGKGIPLEYVTGILPLGEVEKMLVRKIKMI